MKNKAMKAFLVVLSALLVMSCFTCVSFAADAKAVLTFKISDDGYAIVYDCQESAKGVVSIPKKIEIKSKTYKVKYIGDKAFDKCKAITEIYVPEGVTAIGSYAFRNCKKLRDLHLPETLIKCEYDAFNGCSDLVVHCYSSTYQYISICSSNTALTFDIIDPPPEEDGSSDNSGFEELGFIDRFVNALKNLINNLLEYFGANDDDFSIEDLPFDLPFEISTENDNSFIDLF